MKALTPPQIEKVLKVASENKRNHAMILLAYKHGMRASEICDLRMSDIDLKTNEIIVRRKKGSITNTQTLFNETGNPLISEIRVLKAWLAERKSWGEESDYLFLSQKGGSMSRVQFFRIFQSVAQRAGIPQDLRHPHTLKHALGFSMVREGVQMMVIKQALGHKSLQSTALYTSADDAMADKARRQTFAHQF